MSNIQTRNSQFPGKAGILFPSTFDISCWILDILVRRFCIFPDADVKGRKAEPENENVQYPTRNSQLSGNAGILFPSTFDISCWILDILVVRFCLFPLVIPLESEHHDAPRRSCLPGQRRRLWT